jgi:hypothetical protein
LALVLIWSGGFLFLANAKLNPPTEIATARGLVIFASVFGMSFGGWTSGVIFDATGSARALPRAARFTPMKLPLGMGCMIALK